jgi:hypothetical protein
MRIAALPSELAPVYIEIWQDVSWVYGNWAIFLQLYSDDDAISLLNNTAPSYFRVCQDTLLNDILMAICRLTDPAKTGSKTNLSLQRLVDTVDESTNKNLKSELVRLLDLAQTNFDFARAHRNRRLAHIDLKTRMNSHPEPLSGITQKSLQEALDSIATIMNTVQRHFDNGETVYSHPIMPDDGKDLLYWLRKGYDNRDSLI